VMAALIYAQLRISTFVQVEVLLLKLPALNDLYLIARNEAH